jgi:hypothetical protein
VEHLWDDIESGRPKYSEKKILFGSTLFNTSHMDRNILLGIVKFMHLYRVCTANCRMNIEEGDKIYSNVLHWYISI